MPKEPSTAAGRAARDALIVARKAQRWPNAEIAKEADCSAETVKKVLQREKERGSDENLLRQDPVSIIENVLAGYQQDYSLYTHAAVAAAEKDNINALIGAVHGRGQTSDRIIKILQDTGKLPRELGTLRHIIDFRGLSREMVRKLEAVEKGEESIEDAIAFFQEISGLGAPGSQLPALDSSAVEV